jgi:dTDP-4-dehydrorhamnose reductase
MKILITGGKGMLGRTLQTQLREHELQVTDRTQLDVAVLKSVEAAISAFKPNVVIHCAAMTAVDKC